MNGLTIKEIELLSGIRAHTIRIWEQRYRFLKPGRTHSNIRRYSRDELRRILDISLMTRIGFRISQMDKMSEEEIQEKKLSLTSPEARREVIVNEMILCMVDYDMEPFEQAIDAYIISYGIERSITLLIGAFLERIGIPWGEPAMSHAQENLISSVIRQKLAVAIESLVPHARINKSVLLFLPESEFRELGLLFSNYLLKSRGIKLQYLGASLPLEDLEYAVKIWKPNYIYSHLSSAPKGFSLERYLQQLSKRMEKAEIIISGPVTFGYEKKLPPRTHICSTYPEILEFISSIH